MDVLVVLGTTSAYGYGAFMNLLYMIGYTHDSYEHYMESAHTFETSSLLITIIILGKYLESRTKHETTDTITKLASLQISHAIHVNPNGEEREVDVLLLEVGDVIKILPGSSIPTDGVTVSGEGWVDEAMMTGES